MLNRQQWLANRKKGIGGSEIAAILGVDEYKTPFQVWHDKTGRSSEQPKNNYMKGGNKLEKVVVEYWEEESNIKTVDMGHFTHKKYDFILGTPDRVYLNKKGELGVLECKTSQFMIMPDDAKSQFKNFFCQLQWYMGLCEATVGEIAIFGRSHCDFLSFEFEFDAIFYQKILNKAIDFWKNHVLTDIPPDPINAQDIEKLFRKHLDGKLVEATPQVVAEIDELKSIKAHIKMLEAKEDQLTNTLKMILKDSEGFSHENKALCTWRAAKDSSRFDEQAFKAAHPDIYAQYQKSVPGSRRFLLK